MADDPFANFKPPDPFANFKPPTPSGPPAFWNRPVGQSVGDYLGQLWAQQTHGAGQAAQDALRVAADTGSLGTADRAAAGLTGTNLADERAKTAAAYQNMGPMAPIISAATYAMGPGELNIGSRIAGAVAPKASGLVSRVLANALGTGTEGAGVSGLSTLGHGGSLQDAASNAERGGIISAGVGGALGAIGQTPTAAVSGPTEAVPLPMLEKGMKQAFTDAGKVKIDSLDIRDAMRAARAEIAQQPARVTEQGSGALDQISQIEKSTLGRDARSVEDVGDYLKQLHNFKTGDDVPDAGIIAQKHLNSLLDTALPTTGQGVGAGAEALQSAKDATALYKDTKRLQKFQNKAQAGGPDVGSQTKSWLPSDKGMQFAPQGSPLNETMSALSDTAAKGEYMPWWAKHFIVAPMVGTAVGEGLGAMTGERSPWTHIAEDAGIGLAYGLGAKGYSGMTGRTNRLAQQRAFDAAKIAASTGQMPGAAAKAAPVGDLIRRAMLGQMAAGSQ